ncbi:hypothetical protein D1157_19120 [Anaerotruncus sp. X29]|nr:hypothetical protein [Anaerotruncus sp. X29]
MPAPIVIEAPAQPVMEFAQPNYTRTANNNAVIDRIADILSKTDSAQLEQTKTYLIKLLMEALLQPAPGLLLEPGEEHQRLVYDHASILGAFDYIIHG